MSEIDPFLRKLAAASLGAAVRDDWPAASRTLQALADRFGGDGAVIAMLGWIDTFLDRYGRPAAGQQVRLLFKEETTGTIGGADSVSDDVQWAGQLMAARAADDQTAFDALINSAPDDETWSRNVAAVLQLTALGLRETGWRDG
ncbi:hypothetical protein C1I98_11175 [Spongiactinospora gelatinilytica]|uniref:Uncharacterized protein n=1 Tax=Spongiactinospora gelatinilytica TaxID=2666298 RepID=A0A2W2H4T8_9ACTN|nr:hypothetical protein [Spongiactinospora gelatinilytica]PZG49869.1 hypothetical protein C1I98_11175 [Spongiactinospora gelatinilytica]